MLTIAAIDDALIRVRGFAQPVGECLMAADLIREGTFRDGFEVGYRAVRGTSVGMPGVPGQPGTRGNSTPFLMGVRKGIERALGKTVDELRATE
jgi:hypothetical protein